MKFQNFVALAFLATSAQACMQFGARITDDRRLVGAIVDNGRTTCQIDVDLNGPDIDGQFFGNYQDGFACWVSRDLSVLAHANGGNNYRFGIQRNDDNIATSGFC